MTGEAIENSQEAEQPQVELPKYVERAITSQTAKAGDYALLSEEQWREISRHVYNDELEIKDNTASWITPEEAKKLAKPFLRRGNLNSGGRGRKATLDILLDSIIFEHGHGARGYIACDEIAAQVYARTVAKERGIMSIASSGLSDFELIEAVVAVCGRDIRELAGPQDIEGYLAIK